METKIVREVFIRLVPMKGKTTGADLLAAVKVAMDDIGLDQGQLCGMTTDGAPAMVGTAHGVVALMEKERAEAGFTNTLFRAHCIIHQESLCGKSLTMAHVMSVVVKTVNLIRARGLNHRQFQQLLEELNAEYEQLL